MDDLLEENTTDLDNALESANEKKMKSKGRDIQLSSSVFRLKTSVSQLSLI